MLFFTRSLIKFVELHSELIIEGLEKLLMKKILIQRRHNNSTIIDILNLSVSNWKLDKDTPESDLVQFSISELY